MSHYCVAVIHHPSQDIADLLAPYDENLEVTPYIKYSKEEAIKYAREHFSFEEAATDDDLYQMMVDDYGSDMVDENGNILSTYNPDSKWDWYQVGGRFRDMLNVDGEKCDSDFIRDVDFSPREDVYKRSLRFWDVCVNHKQLRKGEKESDFFSLWGENYYIDHYKDRETYARRMAGFSTYAVITPDGVWHSKGEMGWFGISSESAEDAADWDDNFIERFIDAASDEDMITIVDCHI